MYKINNEKAYYIAVFESRSHAIQIYQYLKKSNKNGYQLISTPCKIKSGCSYSLRFSDVKDMELLITESEKFNKRIAGVYLVDKINGRKTYKKVNAT